MQQAEATTDREKAIADYNYEKLKEDISKKYKIALSDNANDAWGQINSLGTAAAQRGLANTGMGQEPIDKYLTGVRKQDQRNRETQLSEEEASRRAQLIKYGTPEEIAALSDEEKEKYGFKPSAETSQWFSTENLKNLYPDLSDQEIANYQSSILDSNGNYMSEIYQKLALNKLDIGEQKKTYQLGNAQYDTTTGRVTGGSGLLYKKALDEEKAYQEFSKADPFSKPTTSTTSSASTISPSNSNYGSVNPDNKTTTVTPAIQPTTSSTWKAPTGYEKVSGPSQLINYSSIIDEPGTINKWGIKK
jgi:hypothetical protein